MPLTKRKHSSISLPSTPPSKRPRPSSQYAPIDPTTGQRTAFPGLEDFSNEYEDGEEGEYEEGCGGEDGESGSREALRYLKAVRAEAATIPTLLVAPLENDRSIYNAGVGDSRGFYSDGAYTAAPAQPDSPTSQSESRPQEIQALYHSRIISRFLDVRASLCNSPPADVLERMSRKRECFMGGGGDERRRWKKILKLEEPKSARLAGMQKGTILKLIDLVGEREVFTRGGAKGVSRKMSTWIWGLLARCPERGELVSEEVGILRELGKTAIWTAAGLRGLDLGALEAGDEDENGAEEGEWNDWEDNERDTHLEMDGEFDEHDAFGPQEEMLSEGIQLDNGTNEIDNDGDEDGEDLAAARTRLLAQLGDQSEQLNDDLPQDPSSEEIPPAIHPRTEDAQDEDLSNTQATIDMIITIVGDLYGQRDLLEFREAWK